MKKATKISLETFVHCMTRLLFLGLALYGLAMTISWARILAVITYCFRSPFWDIYDTVSWLVLTGVTVFLFIRAGKRDFNYRRVWVASLIVLGLALFVLCAACTWNITTGPEDTMVYLCPPKWLGRQRVGVEPAGLENLPSTISLLLTTWDGYRILLEGLLKLPATVVFSLLFFIRKSPVGK